MSLVGIDIGTSSCKAVAFHAGGHVLAATSRHYNPTFLADGRVETDPDTFWRAVSSSLAELAERTAADPIAAVTISSHGESFLPLDGQGRALSPWILNADNRAATEVAPWEESFGRERTFAITGTVVQPAFPLLKLLWLRRHEPDLFGAAARFVGVVDSVLLHMGLAPYLDYSLASRFLLFDVRKRAWSEEILEAAELSPAQLPTLVPAGTVAGELPRAVAEEVGLRPGTPVVVGGHDQACGALGTGAIEVGLVSDSMGTYECLTHVDAAPRLGAEALAVNLNSYCHVVPGRCITIAYFPSGIMLKWYRDLFGTDDPDFFAEAEAAAPSSPTGLCVLPHLIGSATPHFETAASGVIAGLTPGVDRAGLCKGILEGIACEFAIVADLLAGVVGRFEAIRATGGGTRSRLGLRLRAALAGQRLHILESPDSVCLGAALLAGVATGTYPDFAHAVHQAVRITETVEPDPELARAYAQQVRQYRLLYPALAPLRQA